MWLFDGNVLVALAIDSHEFHKRAHRWFDPLSESFATCAITEGTLLRLHMRLAADGSADIARIRQQLNYSQSVFARVLNVSPKTVQAWEQGISCLRLRLDSRIMNVKIRQHFLLVLVIFLLLWSARTVRPQS